MAKTAHDKPEQTAPTADVAAVAASQTAPSQTAPRTATFSVMFTPPERREPRDGAKVPKYETVAIGEFVGLFGPLDVVLGGFNISRPTAGTGPRTLSVFVPSNGYGFSATRHVKPSQIKLAEPIIVDGRERYFTESRSGAAQLRKLEAALIDAWGQCCTVPDGAAPRWGEPIPVVVAL